MKKIVYLSILIVFMAVPNMNENAQQKANICGEDRRSDFFLDIFTWGGNHPMFDEEGGKIVFGDGKQGTRPHKSKHDEEEGHVVFGFREHGVMTTLCGAAD